MTTERLIETISFKNGLELEIYDMSRPLAGDRWLVQLEARIEVDLEAEAFDGLEDQDRIVSVLRGIYGSRIPYCYIQKKHFVDKNKKEEVLQQFIKNIKESQVPYLGHPEFSRRFLLSRYRELKKKKPWLFSEEAQNPE
ncbi:hypothetical protein ACFL9T_07445 [Thermodesulfobacteriota bacterium]